MSAMKKVLIIGSSISGLSAAIALRRSGIEVEIVEISQEWKIHHVEVIAQANFFRAMATLDIADAAIAAGFPYQGIRICDTQGNIQAELPSAPFAVEHYPSNLGLALPTLHQVLYEAATEAGVYIRLGTTFNKILQTPEKVIVRFSDSSRNHYDLVIGADGLHSKVRSHVFGEQYKPHYTGQGMWCYSLPRPLNVMHSYIYEDKRGRKAGFSPLTDHSLCVFSMFEEPNDPFYLPATLVQEFRRRLEGYGGLIPYFRDQITNPEKVTYCSIETLLMPAPWYRGRVLLIGDAAHATTPFMGQDAVQAVEDAIVLGQLCATRELTSNQVLEGFMARRYERSKSIDKGSVQIGNWEQWPSPDTNFAGLIAKMTEVTAKPL